MKIKIRYIDGIRLKRSVIASAQRVKQKQEELNAINVFPVPDGDTGTNMAATMQSIAEGAEKCTGETVEQVSNAIAESALEGARGNSGVILAQFFQGLAEATRGKRRLSTRAFANAVNKAADKARSALSNPREGTIITVMKDWANHIMEQSHKKHDFAVLLKDSLLRARESLAETPKKLPVLKKAGVVDAGAQGFVHLLEGLMDYIDEGTIAALAAGSHMVEKIKHFHTHEVNTEVQFQFCTECLVEGTDLNKTRIKEDLAYLGDSLIVIGSEEKARIHIHTNKPPEVFQIVSTHGTIIKTKIEDMKKQVSDTIKSAAPYRIALVTDSTCDLPAQIMQNYFVHVVPVYVYVGTQSYQDRVEITTNDFYSHMKKDDVRLSTSQPPVGSFLKIYSSLLDHYDSIISIHIAEKLSGTINGARLAAKELKDKIKIDVIDSRTTSAALGLIIAETGQLIEKGMEQKKIVKRIKKIVHNSRIFVSVPTLKYVIRSGRVGKWRGLLGTLVNLKPVITINHAGKIVQAAKVIGRKNVLKKMYTLAETYALSIQNPKFVVVHVLAPELAKRYCEKLKKRFNTESIYQTDVSPALGLHTGIGSVAIAVFGEAK
jgi:uncharacterized protein